MYEKVKKRTDIGLSFQDGTKPDRKIGKKVFSPTYSALGKKYGKYGKHYFLHHKSSYIFQFLHLHKISPFNIPI